MRRVPVESSVIAEIGYEDEIMEVRFDNGGLYRYFNVPPQVCLDLLKADSKGRFFNDEIRGEYPCKRIRKGRPSLRRS
ncbi:MAG: KTSC domain-containing protein [Solirubrobacterales bacterium]